MRTDDLITALATDAPAVTPLRPARGGAAIIAAVGLCCALFLAVMGLREGLAAALSDREVMFKTLLPAAVCLIALPQALRLTRPEVRGGRVLWWLALPLALAGGLWLQAYATRPTVARWEQFTPGAVMECLGLILLLSLVPLLVAARQLRRGATTRPVLAGALAGAGVTAAAATGYSLFCVQDNPVFFITWYGAAIVLAGGLGALAGGLLLRW